MKKRWIVIPSIAVGLLGIAAIGVGSHYEFIEGRWNANEAAAELQTALLDLDGVESATVEYAPFGLPDSTTDVTISFAAGAPSDSWGAADELIQAAARSAELKMSTTSAEFSEAGATVSVSVLPLSLTPEIVADEIESWRVLNDTVGDRVSLRLGAFDPNSATPFREYTVRDSDDMRVVAESWTADLEDLPSTLPTSWIGPGIQTYGAMPTVEYMNALSEVANIVPLASVDGTGTGVAAAVLMDLRGMKVEFLDQGEAGDAASMAQLAAGVTAAFASGAVVVQWIGANHDSYLIAGECGTHESLDGTTVVTTQIVRADDTSFAAQLAAVGFNIPDGVTAGLCQPVTA